MKAFAKLFLRTEANGTVAIVHGFHDGERLQLISLLADHLSALLEALFDYNADALNRSARILSDRDQTLQRATIGEKVVDDQYVISFVQKLLGDDDLIFALVGEGFYLGYVKIALDIYTFGFLGKYHGDAKATCCRVGDGDA